MEQSPEAHQSHHTHTNSSDFFANAKTKLWENRKIIILLIVIFLLAMGIRAHLMRYEGDYLFEPDAYYHARMIMYYVTEGSVPAIDSHTYYQLGGIPPQPFSGYWWFSGVIYNLLALFGAFNKGLFTWSIKFAPTIFGALISIAMYFLSKEVFNSKKVGLVAAFLAAVTPAFAYRTMAGAQGDNSLGFLWMAIGLYFLVMSVKTKHLGKKEIIYSIVAALMFGIMAWTWRMYLLVPIVLVLYTIFAAIKIASEIKNEEKSFLKSPVASFLAKIIITLTIFSVIAYATGNNPIGEGIDNLARTLDVDSTIMLMAISAGALVFITTSLFVGKLSEDNKKIFSSLVVAGLYVGLLAMTFLFITEPDMFYRGGGRDSIGSMVGEESVGSKFFGTKYNALIILPVLALIFLPIMLYFNRREDSHTQIIFWFWTIVTLFMAWYKLKFTFVFGLGLVAGAAIFAYLAFEMIKRFDLGKGIETKTTVVALFFLMVLGVGSAAIFMPDYTPFANSDPALIQTMDWIKSSTPADAKFFNWWNNGHMFSYVTERYFSTDNRNYSPRANQAMAEFVTLNDVNKAYSVAKDEIGADYIILEEDMFLAMPTYEFYVQDKVDYKAVQKYYEGTYRILSCYDTGTSKMCDGSQISFEQFNSLSTEWKSTPDDFYNGQSPLYYYHTTDEVYLLNTAINNSNLAKVWFHSADTNGFYEEVFAAKGMKIFKILK
ncbi:MAG: STT3 domain-containing protein [archaeon]